MTETTGQPGDDFPREPRAIRSRGRGGVTGYGRAPVIATGVLMTAGVALGGWGIAHMFTDGDSAMAQALSKEVVQEVEQPAEGIPVESDGWIYMKLRDADGDGKPDNAEVVDPPQAAAPVEPAPLASAPPAPPKPAVQVIVEGQTLSGISGDTGVPIDLLMAANGIQNPNLIYAGSALVIPPTG